MLNSCNFIGNLGDTPTVSFMPNGKAVTTISLGVNRSWKGQDGQKQTETEWVRIVFFDKLAEIAGEYLKKGSKIHASGRMKTRKWQDQSGQDKYSTEIIGENMIMLDSKPSDSSTQQQSQPSAKPQSKPAANAPGAGNMPPMPEYDDFDDMIPF